MSSLSPTLYEQDVRNSNGNGMNSGSNVQRQGSDAATQSFPLTDIDYESDPAAVAQELSNLQAIRRMSMDVNGMDPDLPAFNLSLGVPTVAPSHRSDEQDPSRLFWVPASVHPELAPNQFKSFIQERVRTLKRSSLSEQPLAPESGAGSLRRRKSMLSRQIDNGNGYEDGATRLERQRSQSGQPPLPVNLQELEELISDPNLVRRSLDSGSEVPMNEDMPILPAKPAGQTLKRSTRTQYRRGSVRKGGVLARRQTLSRSDDSQDDRIDVTGSKPPQLPDVPALPDLSELANVTFGLTRVQTEPIPPPKSVENFSRPGRRAQTATTSQPTSSSWTTSFDEAPAVQKPESPQLGRTQGEDVQPPTTFHSRYANGRPTQYSQPIPEIIEPQPEDLSPPQQHISRSNSLPIRAPERTSSMEQPSPPPQGPLPRPGSQRPQPPRPLSLPQRTAAPPNNHRPANITLDDIASSTTLLPGNGGRTESLSVIPTYVDDGKKSDKKKSKDDGSRKPSWGWFSSSSSEEKEREKREKEEREAAKRNKSKLQKPGETRHDNTRLDVLQNSIDGGQRSRESTVFDRQSLGIPEEAENYKKPTRKTSGEVKKEKDSGIFSNFFGSSKRRTEKEDRGSGKKGSSLRGLSPDPPQRILRPDIDFNWSRFSILEERAIYRMAHIKLANPRRELYSQVLLSNFMYSYLAKVQQMHPQIQIPQSAVQKQQQRQERQQQAKMLEEERKMRQQEAERQTSLQQQPGQAQNTLGVEEFAHYQRYQEVRFQM
jgi:Activator of mitotic machinery Cdc14 phosphatase activation C-term